MRKAHDEAAAVMLRAGLQPIAEYPGVDLPWPCLHTCGAQVAPTYSNIKRGQGGCLTCAATEASRRLIMPEADARGIMIEAGLDPQEPYPGCNRPWTSLHTCGRSVSPTLSNVRAGKGICRYCNSDFPYDGPSLVYLVADHDAVKIGICAPQTNRIYDHTRYGWLHVWTVEVPTGDDAYNIEQAVIAWWRQELMLPPAYRAGQMPQSGYSETASWEDMHPTRVLEQVGCLGHELGLPSLESTATWHAHQQLRPATLAGPFGVRARAQQARWANPLQPGLWD